MPGRTDARRSRDPTVKPDPGSADQDEFPAPSQHGVYPGGSPGTLRGERRAFHRSDAPTPSENQRPQTEDGDHPMLMEMRVRNNVDAAPGTSQGDSFFNSSFRDIGQKVRACNETLAELQQLGVQHAVSLPELVLVGDQSSGKSSLMSGLADINLPRSDGVCTRCPIHIRVSRSRDAQWSCRVSLQQDYALVDRPVTIADVTKSNPFPPWAKQPRVTKEFMMVTKQDDLETAVKWAQIAILNPETNHEIFVPGSHFTKEVGLDKATEGSAADFSPNLVALEIKGPDLPELSFYDLPGIFRSHKSEDKNYLVRVVKNLAKEYITHSRAILICAIPMTVDAELSETLHLIRELKALDRTIGVLTKADMLGDGPGNSADRWVRMLRGLEWKTGYGYFMTSRRPEQSLDQLNTWEEHFFGTMAREQWSVDLEPYADKLGVEKLKVFLSVKLGDEFAKRLPYIKNTLAKRLDSIHGELDRLPELPQNVEFEVRKALMQFCNLAKTDLRSTEFSSQHGRLAKNFRDCILWVKPKFTLRDPTDFPVIEILDDESDTSSTTTPSSKRSRQGMLPPQTPKRQRIAATPGPSRSGVKPEDIGSPGSTASAPPTRGPMVCPLEEPFKQYQKLGSGFRTLRQIREDIQSKTKPGLTGLTPVEVYEDLCARAVKPWDGPMLTFLDATVHHVHACISLALEKSFGSLRKRLVFMEATQHLKSFVDAHYLATRTFLLDIYDMEAYQAFTNNDEALERYKREEGLLLTRYRHHMRWRASPFGDKAHELQDWDLMTDEQKSADERARANQLAKMGDDQFKAEVGVASYVRGYYRLSALRFADTVAQAISSRMIPKLILDLDCYLETKLGLIGSAATGETFAHLMEEDVSTAHTREKLRNEQLQFEQALKSIAELERQSAVGESESRLGGDSDSDGMDEDGVF